MVLLKGKNILVTGGSRGIGKAIVETSVENGAVAGFTYLNSEKKSRELEKKLGDSCIALKADSADRNELEGAVFRFLENVSSNQIDGLVINAGVYKRSPFSEMELEDWKKTLEVNLDGAYNTVKAALPSMKKGSIVMVSSQLAFKGSSYGADYAASKAGMLGMARSLARELAPYIRVNSIAPGYVDTDILAGDSPEKRKKRISQVPLGRIASPVDIAGPVVFLLSDMSEYVTGATLDINGGLFIH